MQPPEISHSISIAKSPRLAATGEFVTAGIVDVDDLEPDATTWSPTRALPAGTYWWHVVQSLKLKWAGRQFLATLSLKANVSSVNVLVQLYSKKRLLGSHRATTSNFLLDQATDDQSIWTLSPAVRHGSPLRLVVTLTVRGDRATATVTKTFRAP